MPDTPTIHTYIDGFVGFTQRSSDFLSSLREQKLAQITHTRDARDAVLAALDDEKQRQHAYFTQWLELLETELRAIDAHVADLGLIVPATLPEPAPQSIDLDIIPGANA